MDEFPKGLSNSGAKEIADRLKIISGGKVLDVGTEKGGFISTLIQTLKDYESFVGIDISFKELESIRKEFSEDPVEFFEMNAEKMDFKDKSFDTVSIAHSIHHFANIDKVFKEIKRVLKANGYLLIQEPFYDGTQTEAQHSDILQHHWSSRIDTLLGIPHNTTFSKEELKAIVKNLGLKKLQIVESTHYVKCLFCEEKFECDDPKNKKIIEFTIKEIDQDIERLLKLKGHPDFHKLKEEGEKFKKKVKRTGSAPASHLFFIGKI
ncbi:MAG: class I SAM-dependent methyltransferase [Candidatus Heimdallarchaeota archaeon]|nr:MAG: class I SAM-dependent methyltransferase [Candidatus Heimdallarchaeota archaeon]